MAIDFNYLENVGSEYAKISTKAMLISTIDVALNLYNRKNAELHKLIRIDLNNLNKENRFGDDVAVISFEPVAYRKGDVIVETQLLSLMVADFKVQKNKRVIENYLNKSHYSIKEITGGQEYSISINAFLIGNYNEKPIDKLEQFNEIMNLDFSLPIICEELNTLGINYLTVQNFSFDSNFSSKNTFPITIQAISDSNRAKIII